MNAVDKNRQRWAQRPGRLLKVQGIAWKWQVGKGGNVIAYSEAGERRCAEAWKIHGITPDTFERGQYKKTTDGMVRPGDVSVWLKG